MDKSTFLYYASCYGSLENWPGEVKQEASSALAANPDWQAILDSEQKFEQQLDQYEIHGSLASLEQAILKQTLNRTPNQTDTQSSSSYHALNVEQGSYVDQFIEWLLPSRSLWRPTLAACLPILVGISLGANLELEEQFSLAEEVDLVSLESPYLLESLQLPFEDDANES